jgi:hypothetical protein
MEITVKIPDPMQISGILRGAHATLHAQRAYPTFFHNLEAPHAVAWDKQRFQR